MYKLNGTLPLETARQNPRLLFEMLEMLSGEETAEHEEKELPPSLGWMAGL